MMRTVKVTLEKIFMCDIIASVPEEWDDATALRMLKKYDHLLRLGIAADGIWKDIHGLPIPISVRETDIDKIYVSF